MESLLFTLDLFLMVSLVWAVFRAERKAPEFRDLGRFSHRDLNRGKSEQEPPRA